MLEPEDKDGQVQEARGRSATDDFLDKLRGERIKLVRVISSKPGRPMFSVNHSSHQSKKSKKDIWRIKRRIILGLATAIFFSTSDCIGCC